MVIASVCSLLFLGFSFAYLYALQGELMRCLHRYLCGTDTYSPLWGALAITFVLWGVRWLFNQFLHWERTWLALSYFPAYWALALFTCGSPVESGETLSWEWHGWWLFPVTLLFYLSVGLVCRNRTRSERRQKSLADALIPNLIVLILFSFATGCVGNSNELLHNKLLVAQNIREQRYEEALLVGKKSLHNTHPLTTLRALALSHAGVLGESLFEYPQSGKSDGLFFQQGQTDVCGFTNEDIEFHLGNLSRKADESVVGYLSRICASDSTAGSPAIDYYLCALLLEKQLPLFHQALSAYWPAGVALPRHYQEALLVYQLQMGKESPFASLCTSSVKQRFHDFRQLQAQYELPLHQNNYTRRKFGDTYWWYYWYGE